MNSSYTNYIVQTSNTVDVAALESKWKNLTKDIDTLTFFHSWEWISTWLELYQPDILLASVSLQGETVALGLFGRSVEQRHRVLRSRQLRLFQTGDCNKDQIWVEFNDIIARSEHLEGARQACISALLSGNPACDEIVLSMMPRSHSDGLIRAYPQAEICLSSPRYRTDLMELAKTHASYLSSLKRNSRYQINLSRRRYESSYGSLRLDFADSSRQALEYLAEAGKMHIDRWSDSGFLNRDFVDFHTRFIERHFDAGFVDIVRIRAGNHIVAIIYNIIFNRNVYFYLQGLQPEADGKLKPGLTAHAILIEYYLDKNMKSYDFMGGYSQYKKQLSEADDELLIVKIQKPLLKFRLENMARRIKRKLS
jgi:CelD/BcsL family acetyltransferase involved in cellulose biosynthesis